MGTWFVALHSSFMQFGWRRAPWLQEGCSFQMMLRVTPGSLFVFSLRGRLTLLVIVAVLPLLCLVLAEVYSTYRSVQARFSGRAQDCAHALSQALQADHQVRMAALQTLALSPALRAGDVEVLNWGTSSLSDWGNYVEVLWLVEWALCPFRPPAFGRCACSCRPV